mgnify:CR=1 FL=1
MIKTATIIMDNRQYMHTYSDAGYYIRRDGILYAEAIDPLGSERTYTETDIPLEVPENETQAALDILMGVTK